MMPYYEHAGIIILRKRRQKAKPKGLRRHMTDHWNGVPGNYLDDPTAIDDRRFIATPHGWQKVRLMLKDRAKFRCEKCGVAAYFGDVHRIGSKRDDRIEVNGVRLLVWMCSGCHESKEILPWESWKRAVS